MDEREALPFDRAVIDEIVEGARARLLQHHPGAASPRFPFGMHHACTRRQVRLPTTRRHLAKPEIAEKLVEWAALHGGASLYAWQGVATAVAELVATGTETPAALSVLSEAQTALGGAPPFLPWLKQSVSPRARSG